MGGGEEGAVYMERVSLCTRVCLVFPCFVVRCFKREGREPVLEESSLRRWCTIPEWHLVALTYCAPSVGSKAKIEGPLRIIGLRMERRSDCFLTV